MDARIPDGLTAIRQGWFLKDILDAHDILDSADAAAAAARQRDKGTP